MVRSLAHHCHFLPRHPKSPGSQECNPLFLLRLGWLRVRSDLGLSHVILGQRACLPGLCNCLFCFGSCLNVTLHLYLNMYPDVRQNSHTKENRAPTICRLSHHHPSRCPFFVSPADHHAQSPDSRACLSKYLPA